MIQTGKIAEITDAKLLSFHTDAPIHHLLLDSRKIISPSDSLFFAIKGVRHDGHLFLSALYKKGIRSFIVENNSTIPLSEFPEASFWQVPNAIEALQKIVAYHRSHYTIPVIGITGSNGKTIVKEWLSQLLNKDFRIVKNPKSYNSQIGVPLSVWEMNEHHTLGIFEAGISLPQEMERLEKVIRPSIGLFTNIGPAHDEGFKSTSQKIAEKLNLFSNSEIIFYRKDHAEIHQAVSELPIKRFCWSDKETADVQIVQLFKNIKDSTLNFRYRNESFVLRLPFADDASIENILHCICVLLYFNHTVAEIQDRLSTLLPVAMRLELKEGINGSYIIDDTYNNDLSGLRMAVNFLDQQKQRSKKTIILSDLLESGVEDGKLYRQKRKKDFGNYRNRKKHKCTPTGIFRTSSFVL